MDSTLQITRETVRIGRRGPCGELSVPPDAHGLVLFAHGSDSSRACLRNRWVAACLQRCGLATLLLELMAPAEAFDRRKVLHIELLGRRLGQALDWAVERPDLAPWRPGLFGAGSGGDAALLAAAARPCSVAAVVSRGGRIDLTLDCLPLVSAPTLLVVDGADSAVVALNRAALQRLQCRKRLEVLPGAAHSSDGPGAQASVATLAGEWFDRALASCLV